MAYNINTFLKPLSQSDRLIQIIDSNGVVKYSINPFTVKNTFVRGNVIYISLNSDREILIDFRNQTESRQAIVLLESQLETLRNKAPNYIDRIIEEYIHGIGLSYSNGNLYFSANLIPSINSTYSIGLSGSSWLDLHVASSSIYLGGVKLSTDGTDLLINDDKISNINANKLINGNLEMVLDNQGTLNMPLLLPVTFSAVLDVEHMVDPIEFDNDNWWEFQVQFQVDPNGVVETLIDNIFPILENPGYESGFIFNFTEVDHGIPDFTFGIQLNDVISATFGWEATPSVTLPPNYPSTIKSLGAIKLTSNDKTWTIATDGTLISPDSFEISSPEQSMTWLGKTSIETINDGITTTINEVSSHLYSTVDEVGLESYDNPDGLNNIIKGKVRTFPGGVILESSTETVSGTVSGSVVVSANGFQFNQTDGVIENNFELSDTLYINGVDYLSKGGILTQTFLLNSNNYDYIINGADSLILSSSVFDVVSDFISIDSTGSGQILADTDLTFMAGGEMSIIGSSSLITTNNGKGLVYTEDYSANFVDNSLVSKKFVLDNINSGGAGGAGKIWQYGGGPLGDGLFNYFISGTFVSVTVDYDDVNGTARDWTLTTSKLIDSGEKLFVSMVDLTNPSKYLTYEAYEYFDGGGFSINGILYQNGTSFTTGSNISFAYSTVAKNAGQQGPVGPTGSQGDSGPQGPTGPSGVGGGARFINTILPNSPGSLSPVNFQLFLPWPYDSQRGMSIQNEYINIDSSDIVRWYNVQLSFQIYNSTNEPYGYSLKCNTGGVTYSLFDTTINGATDYNKRQTFTDILRVPVGATATLYFMRYTSQTDEEAVLGNLNIIEII